MITTVNFGNSSKQALDCDVAIIGGGIAGVSVAHILAQEQINFVIFEKERQLFSKASHAMLRIMHGGLRYLQSLDIPRALASLKNQSYLLEKYPDFVKPLACYMPIGKRALTSRVALTCATLLYSLLIKASKSKILSPKIEHQTNHLGERQDYFKWYDAVLEDPSLLETHLISQLPTQSIKTGCEVLEVNQNSESVKIKCRDNTFHVKSALIACGKSSSDLIKEVPNDLVFVRGFNLLVKDQLFTPNSALAAPGYQNRMLFAVSRNDQVAIGTEYLPLNQAQDELVSDTEAMAFMKEAEIAFKRKLTLEGIEAGIIPVKSLNPLKFLSRPYIKKSGRIVHYYPSKYASFLSEARLAVKELLA
jgi:glycerol-3-phosphate dehydrogenase